MAETKGEQYLTELLFDISKIPDQFREINQLLVSEGTTLKQLMEQNWDIGAYLKNQAAAAEKAVAESTKKMETSWQNAYKILRGAGDPFADVANMLKSDGKRLAVVWTDEMEREFRTRMPELKKQLSEWIQWVGEGQGMQFDGMLSNDLIERVPALGDSWNQMDMLEELNEGLQRYREAARQIVETGSMFSDDISESERLRAAYEALTGQAQDFYRIRKDSFTRAESGGASYDEMYAYLQRCAAEAAALASTEAKIKVQLNEEGEIRKAAITYTDQQNRSVQSIYGWYEKLNIATGETERAFGQIGSTVIDDKLARAAASAKELEQNARQFETAYERTAKSLAQSAVYMESNHMGGQLENVKKIAVQAKELRENNFDITKETLSQMKCLQEQAKQIAAIVQQEKDRKATAAAEKAEREKVLSLNREIATVQKQIRTSRIDDAKLSREAALLRDQSDELVRQLQVSGKLTDEERERLSVLEKQLSFVKTQATATAADGAGAASAQKGVLASAAQWFGAYQLWHQALRLGKETVSTMKDVEMSVTEVSRVINDASFEFNGFTGDIFKLAEDYGRSFDDTIDISTRFAQAGYNVSETLSMTKDSLLALNTAELDAKNATQSIIGIMQQWQFEPEKMIGVIDRINKVADNYAITSQDLVDGLLKSSSMAKQANLSFEQTVGILTAMKTASGAAGKEVGNAFKSILAFIQRPDSIKGFEELGIRMIADETTGALRPMMDILKDMSNKWNDTSDTAQTAMMGILDKAGAFSQEMAIAIGAQDDFTAAQNEFSKASDKANDAETRQQANLAAGVYRRNYYTALMENFSRVYDIVLEQQDADGYSMQENAKYMGTLQAKYNSLLAALKELAVVTGKNGMMDIAKWAVEAATSLAKFTTNAGGLLPVMTALLGLFVALKREKLAGHIDGVVTSIASLKNIFSGATTAANGTAVALSGVGSAASAALGVFGLLTTAISMAVMAANNHAQAVEEQKAAIYNAAQAARDEADSLDNLVQEYRALGQSESLDEESRTRLSGIQEQIIKLLGLEADALDLVNGKYEDNINVINEASKLKLEDAQRAAQAALNQAKESADNPEQYSARYDKDYSTGWSNGDSEAMRALEAYSKTATNFKADIEQIFGTASFEAAGTAAERVDALRKAMDFLAESGYRTSNEYNALSAALQHYVEISDLEIKKTRELNEITAQLQVTNALQNETLPKSYEEYEELRESLISAGEASGEYAGKQEGVAAAVDSALGKIPEFAEYIKMSAEATQEAEEGIDSATQTLEAWSETLSSMDVSSLETNIQNLESALQKLNDGVSLNYDEMARLIDAYPDLAEHVAFLADGYSFEKSSLEEVLGAQQNLRAEIELSKVATDYLRQITEQLKTATGDERDALIEQRDALADAVREWQSAGDETERFTSLTEMAIKVMAGFKSGIGGFVGKIANTISEGISLVQKLLGSAGSNLKADGYTSKNNYSGGSSGGKSAAEKAAEKARQEARKKADKEIKRLQKLSKEKQKSYDDEIKALRKASEAEQKDYEKRIKHLQKLKEESKKYYDEQIKQVKKKYDDEIDALKKVEEERSRARERADIEEEIAYWKKRSGVEAMEKIAELQKELSRKEEDWSTEDQIEKLENLRDAEVERLEETRDAMDERYDAEIENLQAQKEAAKEAADARIEQIQEEKEAEKEKYDNWIEYLREISGDSDSTAEQILQAIENVKNGAIAGAEQISWTLDSLTQKAVRSINNAINSISDGTEEYSGKVPANTGRYVRTSANVGQIPKSHTGSEVRSGGLVEVAPAEIIVNPEISRGLRRMMERERQIQNYYNQNIADNHGKTVNLNSPLYYVAKQEIADKADLQMEKNDVERILDRALANLT